MIIEEGLIFRAGRYKRERRDISRRLFTAVFRRLCQPGQRLRRIGIDIHGVGLIAKYQLVLCMRIMFQRASMQVKMKHPYIKIDNSPVNSYYFTNNQLVAKESTMPKPRKSLVSLNAAPYYHCEPP